MLFLVISINRLHKRNSTLTWNKSEFSLLRRLSTRRCPHVLPSATMRRRCCWAPAPAIDQYLLSAARGALSSKPAGGSFRQLQHTAAGPSHTAAFPFLLQDWLHGFPRLLLLLLGIPVFTFYFLFLFYTFQLSFPCGRWSWLMSAFERTLR